MAVRVFHARVFHGCPCVPCPCVPCPCVPCPCVPCAGFHVCVLFRMFRLSRVYILFLRPSSCSRGAGVLKVWHPRTGQPGLYSQDRTAETAPPGQNGYERTTWHDSTPGKEREDRIAITRTLGQGNLDRTTATKQHGQDSQGRMFGTGYSEQDSLYGSASTGQLRQGSQDRTVCTEPPGQNS